MGQYLLLVEDNEDDIELTMRAFRKNHLENQIFVVRDGLEAIEYIFATDRHQHRNAEELPAAILLDLKLPGLDGLQVLERLRANERTRLLPVVVLTSSSRDRDMVESYRLGANSYVQKPVNFSDFIDATKQLGLYWLLLNRQPT